MRLRALFLGLSVTVACIVGTLHAQAPDPCDTLRRRRCSFTPVERGSSTR